MCIVISVVDDLPKIAIWDPDEVSILVARGTATGELMREVAAILTIDLGAAGLGGRSFRLLLRRSGGVTG